MDATAGAEPSDAELITLVRGGDRAAYGVLYERHRAAAQRLARQYSRPGSDADDLTAEAFARVLDTLLAGRGPDTAFRAYLLTALRHTAFDRTRKDSKLQFTDDLTPHESAETPDDPVVADLENSLVARAFQALPERWQAVLWHTQVEQESAEQVGEFLGITANAVTSLTFRAREGLRAAYLQAHLNDTAAEQCRTTTNRLGAWARGSLSKRETTQVEAHLDECDDCRALAAELTELNTSLRGLLAPLLLGGAAAGYVAATATPVAAGTAGTATASSTTGSSTGATVAAHPWWLAVAGAGVVAAITVAIVTLTSPGAHETAAGSGPPVAAPATTTSPPTTSQPTASSGTPGVAPALPGTASSPLVSTSMTPPATITDSPTTAATTPSTASSTMISTSMTPPAATTGSPTTAATTPSTTSSTTSSTSTATTTAPPPAAVGAPAFDQESVSSPAGGSADVSFSVTNSGGTDSDEQTLSIDTPDGITITGASASASPAGSGFRGGRPAWLHPPGDADTSPVRCADGQCRYTVPAETTLTITLTLTIAPNAQAGDITLNGDAGSATLPITLTPALTKLLLGTADTDWTAGRGFDGLPLRGLLADGVTLPNGVMDLPSITLPMTVGGTADAPALRLIGPQGSCEYHKEQLTMTCDAVSAGAGIVSFGTWAVAIGSDAEGPVALSAVAAGSEILVLDATAKPIDIEAAPPPSSNANMPPAGTPPGTTTP